MIRFILAAAFILSIVMLPWFASVALAVLYLAEGGSVALVVFGGVCADIIFGAPVASLHGFSYLLTLVMVCLALTVLFLRQRLFE